MTPPPPVNVAFKQLSWCLISSSTVLVLWFWGKHSYIVGVIFTYICLQSWNQDLWQAESLMAVMRGESWKYMLFPRDSFLMRELRVLTSSRTQRFQKLLHCLSSSPVRGFETQGPPTKLRAGHTDSKLLEQDGKKWRFSTGNWIGNRKV